MNHSIFKIRLAKTAICFLFVSLFCVCSKEDNGYYEVKTDKTEIVFIDNIDNRSFTITSEGEWHLEAKGLEPGFGTISGQAAWYEVDKMYGYGNSTVTITLRKNKQGDHAATLAVVGKYNRINVSLTQQARNN